jgi:hypothetical protein
VPFLSPRTNGATVRDEQCSDIDELSHRSAHISAIFDGALQFAREALSAAESGHFEDVTRRHTWIRAVLVDLTIAVRWGTGAPGTHLGAMLWYLIDRMESDTFGRHEIICLRDDLAVLADFWAVLAGEIPTARTVVSS